MMSPGRREDVDHLLEDVGLERLDELLGVGDLVTPLHELPQPGDLRFDAGVGAAAFLVAPVGGDAVLGDVVHLPGADLDLDRVTSGPMTAVCRHWYMLSLGVAM